MKTAATKGPGRPVDQELWERRRTEILHAASQLFAEHGYTDADTQTLADRLQVAKGTIYRYFPSKQDLFLAAVDNGMRRLREHVDAEIAGVADPLDRLARAVRAYLAFFADHPRYVELLIQERAQFKDRKKPTYFEHRDADAERWHELFRGLIAEGRVRNVPVEQMTGVISDLLYGTMFTNYFTGQHRPPEAQAQGILDIVFQGILTDPERQRRATDHGNS